MISDVSSCVPTTRPWTCSRSPTSARMTNSSQRSFPVACTFLLACGRETNRLFRLKLICTPASISEFYIFAKASGRSRSRPVRTRALTETQNTPQLGHDVVGWVVMLDSEVV
jgi:hypothetical protein